MRVRSIGSVLAVVSMLACASVAPRVAVAAGSLTTVPASSVAPAVPIYVATPHADGRFPAVLFLHGCGGFTGFEAVAADKIAAHGYVGVALDSIGPGHPDGACGDRSGDRVEADDARATLAWLRTQPDVDPDRLAVVGFSMGGIAVLDLVDPETQTPPPPGLRAAVAYYPYCGERGNDVGVPLAIFDGDADEVTPVAPCAAMVSAAKAAGKAAEITTYPGATHSFNVPLPDREFYGKPLRYDAAAAADAALKTFAFLERYLKPVR